ncbi:MAG TPA: acyl-CoA dehydrogenase family protein [Acidimicrobiia bacterium]|nr:acyl-CoA dehydrogenase family protein [Acidimicrobiia bacterium]
MNFAFSEEQEELRRYARQWMTERMPLERVRTLMSTPAGFDGADWAAVAELGWQAMAIPEEYGGAGFGLLELAVLVEEQGRGLFCGPFLSTVMAAANAVLLAGSDEQKQSILSGIASGDLVATLAVAERHAGWDGENLGTSATPQGEGWIIDGAKRFVLDGHTADLIIVAAQTPDGVGLFLVDGGAPGMSRTLLPTMDETRKQAEIAFEGVRVAESARLPHGSTATLAAIDELMAVSLALEQVGGAQAVLDMAVQYAKDRQQFGRPIGSFQAVKHMCADMLLRVESARAAAYYAAWTVAEGSEEAATVVPLAKAYCSDAFFECAGTNIQIHGGIGFTWEHDAHLYFKRAKSSQVMFGTPAQRREQLAERLGL